MEKPKIKKGDFGSNLVTKHNDLITARFDLTVIEFKLLVGCISKVNSFHEISSDTEFSFSLEEASSIFGFDVNNSGAVKHFKEAALGLMDKKIVNDTVDSFSATNIAQDASYNPDTKVMSICFTRKIAPYISKMGNNWTSYRVMHIGQMTSKYALNLYELLVKDLMNNYYIEYKKEYSIEDFKGKLGLSVDKYSSISMLKKNVINPAVDQINKFSDLNVEVDYLKTGRTITKICLSYGYKDEWAEAELQHKKTKKLTNKQVQKILDNPMFISDFLGEFPGLNLSQFLNEAKKILMNKPLKFGNDYMKYLSY